MLIVGTDGGRRDRPMIDAAVQAVAKEIERIINPPSDNVVILRREQAQC